MGMGRKLKKDILRILHEMRFDGKSTGLFSNEETIMPELDDNEEEDNDLGWEGDPWDYIEYGGFMDDEEEEEELPTVRRSDRDRARRRPYSPKARFRGGLSEQEIASGSLDGDLELALDDIHDDIIYTLPGYGMYEDNLGKQIEIYDNLKMILDDYPASKQLPQVKEILDRLDFKLQGLGGFRDELVDLYYYLSGRYEASPQARQEN